MIVTIQLETCKYPHKKIMAENEIAKIIVDAEVIQDGISRVVNNL